jgi:PIN domain nuclease of toxin-antitoxin system
MLRSPLALSDATRWEIFVKIGIGKLPRMPGLAAVLTDLGSVALGSVALGSVALGSVALGMSDRYLARLETLPFHHRDPFDRMIIARVIDARL